MTKYFFAIFLFVTSFTQAQVKYKIDSNYFSSPIGMPITIVANYGELRNNHFHNGLDIRTPNGEGMHLYAMADGYISRIKIAPKTYGNVLYVTHKNGITSMYAHCSKFTDSIQKYIQKFQFDTQTFEQDVFLKENEIVVKKEQQIAFSGNTGASQGPHLHFELHDAKTNNVLNPFLYGIKVKDNTTPIIRSIFLNPLDTFSRINNSTIIKKLQVNGKAGNYKLSKLEPIKLYGNIGLGIDVFDQHTGSSNADNIYSLTLLVDDEVYCHVEHDEMPFDHNRYLNSYCNYTYKKSTGTWIQNLYIDKCNKLALYKKNKNNGVIKFDVAGEHKITVVAIDVDGNVSSVNFYINYNPIENTLKNSLLPQLEMLLPCNVEQTITKYGATVTIPAFNNYLDYTFNFSKDSSSLFKAPVYKVLSPKIPSHSYFKLELPITHLPIKYRSKAIVLSLDYNGHSKCEGGKIADNKIQAESRSYGRFIVQADTVPPNIIKLTSNVKKVVKSNKVKIKKGKKTKTKIVKETVLVPIIPTKLSFKIYDSMSGIKTYKVFIDNKWELFEYDEKYDLIKYYISKTKYKEGAHTIKVVVEDLVGNVKILEDTFEL